MAPTSTPAQRGNIILSSQRLYWRVVKTSEDVGLDYLKNEGMADDRSEWVYHVDDKGRVIIFNECITSGVFDFFNSEFFAKSEKDFDKKWRRVERLLADNEWRDYVPSSGSNSRNAFKKYGWMRIDSIFVPPVNGEDMDDDYTAPDVLVTFKRKIMS
ncbi:MAG: hypothetical protein ABSF47_00010 [Minisyncoccia bacterium]|jgi:hypothetical protein